VEFEHQFAVPIPVEEAWPILLDIRRVAACMPGAAVDSVDGDDFTGTVKVKLGPIGLTYKGQASFVEKDEEAHVAVLDARGRDARGSGTASAHVTARLEPDGAGTQVRVLTRLDITGKPAQFGRGVMKDVADRLIGEFADRLADTIRAERATPDGGPVPDELSAATAPARAAGESRSLGSDSRAPGDESLDLIGSAAWPIAKRLLPAVVAVFLAVLARRRRLLRRGRRPRQ
jgi:carbon monoxide dehydrogenase subunit G